MRPIYKFSPSRLTGFVLLLAVAGAMAQPVYRQVDKNGRVTFSDRAPTASTEPAANAQPAPATGANAGLPYELRQIAQRYPVTLYSGDECSPCSMARTLLTTRGIPFQERTVNGNQDVEALQKLSGQTSLPLLTIGTQQLPGFSDTQWAQYLDAAGYPRSNGLPSGYRNPPAQPMVAQVTRAPAPAPAAPRAAPDEQPLPAAPPSGPTPENPAGIKF